MANLIYTVNALTQSKQVRLYFTAALSGLQFSPDEARALGADLLLAADTAEGLYDLELRARPTVTVR